MVECVTEENERRREERARDSSLRVKLSEASEETNDVCTGKFKHTSMRRW